MNQIIRLSARGIGVHFWHAGDRYGHQVASDTASEQTVWLSSVEGAADASWPPSPPLQELHLEDRPDGKRVALLVGRAGRAHWSLSVEADSIRQSLLFDVACRSLSGAEQMRSSYRLPDGCRREDNRLLFSCHELCLLEGEMQFDGAELSIGPRRDMPAADKVRTFRWRYRIEPANAPAY